MRVHNRPALPALAALIAASLIAACGGGNGAVSGDAGHPVSGGTLRFGLSANLECLDPHQSPSHDAGLLSRPILDSLVTLDKSGRPVPWLATSWTVSADQLTYTFTLRQGVRFTDGESFDAAAVKANLDEIVAPSTKSLFAAQSIAAYSSSTVVGPATVAVRLTKPSSSFLPALASPFLGIEAPATLANLAAACQRIIGTGPFASAGGYVSQRGIQYVRNPDYRWAPGTRAHQGPAYLSGIDVQIVTDNEARVGALTSGQLEAVAAVPPVDVARLRSSPQYAVRIVPTPGVDYTYFPNNQFGVFSDQRVREAFRAGIDFSVIVDKLYFGVYKVATGPLSSSTIDYDPSGATAYTYDPVRAARLLDEAGWTGRDAQGYRTKNGKRLTAVRMFVQGKDDPVLMAQIQAAAKQLGMQIVDNPVDVGTFVQRDIAGQYDVSATDFASTSPDVLRVLFSSADIASPTIGVGNNVARYSNAAVDADFQQALATTDPARQKALYAAAQRQITADAAVIPIYQGAYVLGSAANVHGVDFLEQSYPGFYDAWLSR